MTTDSIPVRPLCFAVVLTLIGGLVFFKILDSNRAADGPRSVESLMSDLEHPYPENRLAALRELSQLGAEAKPAIPGIVNRLADEDIRVRCVAIAVLGAIDRTAPGVVPALARSLQDRHRDVRQAAVVTFTTMGPEAKEALPALETMMRSRPETPEDDFRALAAQAILVIDPGNESALQVLLAMLHDTDALVRKCALIAFEKLRIDKKEVVLAIATRLADPVESVRRRAAVALDRPGVNLKPALPALVVALKDKSADVRLYAAHALGRLEGEAKDAIPALIQALKVKDVDFRTMLLQTLADIGPAAQQAVPALITLSQDVDREVRLFALNALGRIGPGYESVPILMRAIKEGDATIRSAAVGALAGVAKKDKRVIAILKELLNHDCEDVKSAAQKALDCLVDPPQ